MCVISMPLYTYTPPSYISGYYYLVMGGWYYTRTMSIQSRYLRFTQIKMQLILNDSALSPQPSAQK